MRGELGRLRNDGDIGVVTDKAALLQQLHDFAQKHATVNAFVCRIRIGEMAANIAQRRSTQQRITQSVQGHITVAVRFEAAMVWDADATQPNAVTVAKGVYIVAVPDSHMI
jgi:type IV secretory pathway VirJ component